MADCCSICLNILRDPVTIPCGHSYCIKCYLYRENDKGIYRCPQCGQTFIPSPVLNRNTKFAELEENLKKTRLQATPPDHHYAGPEYVDCDSCTGRKLKAFKSCLVCLASYCEIHLQPHYDVAPLKKHKLVQASTKLQEKICSHHDKLLEIYCLTDEQCICYLCMLDEHKGHDTVSAASAWTEKQKHLLEEHQKFQLRIKEKEEKIQELRNALDSLKHSAQAAVEDSERIFTELIHSFRKRHSELKELIRAQEKAEVSRAEGLLEQLEQEVSEMRRRDVELKQLSHTEDNIHFLQNFQSLSVAHGSEYLLNITIYPNICFEHVKKSISELN
ncbi:tripartite motif-containing protein 29 isoform X8 [Esox lucius]|uniref:B box-type domain-containing protein n=1 Tax=Esox lucius TaxID=8010 RepID=A0A3P8XQJ4_ESOLU|nr:tripartite motif-containing protein 29 isoform X8 [Esox lucius]